MRGTDTIPGEDEHVAVRCPSLTDPGMAAGWRLNAEHVDLCPATATTAAPAAQAKFVRMVRIGRCAVEGTAEACCRGVPENVP